jgi:hypothetical protein
VSWPAFIDSAPKTGHAVQVYEELDELSRSVVRYVDAGLRTGAPAIVIATRDHSERFKRDLKAREWDPGGLEKQGLLTYMDADEALAAIMDFELPSPERFADVVGRLVDEVAARFPDRTIRAFGEMVDLLWQRGREDAAIALEGLWNELQQRCRFALLCGYHLDIFDIRVQAEELPRVFHAHTHAQPVEDNSQLAAALDQALAEIVGSAEAARIYLDVAERVPRGSLPRAQAVLGWLSTSGNRNAARVLERTRIHYLRMHRVSTLAFSP